MRSLVAVLLLASCLEVTTEPVPEQAPALDSIAAAPPPGEKDQGRYLNGSVADGKAINNYHLHTSPSPAFVPAGRKVTQLSAASGNLAAYDGTTLQFSGADARFAGIELQIVGSTSRLRILSISPTPNARYVLAIVNGSSVTPYCADGGGAFASPGRWTTTGAHEQADTINFTCSDGVIWKCFTWGYDPGIAPNPTVDARQDPWRVHQACTRMARADRCGNGVTNTYEETTILIRDRVAGGQPNIDDPNVASLRIPTVDPPPLNQFWFESAWTADGAICLSAERWKSMPIEEDTCMEDPRKNPDPDVATCDQIGIETLKTTATFFNGAKVGQLYLNLWHRGGEQLVTVRGMAGKNGVPARPPFPGYIHDAEIGLLMRNPPASLSLPGSEPHPDLATVGLYRFTSGWTDRVVTTSAPTGYSLVATEGYVYTNNPENAYLPFYLYSNGAEFVSSVEPPTETGWNQVGPAPLGYIDPP